MGSVVEAYGVPHPAGRIGHIVHHERGENSRYFRTQDKGKSARKISNKISGFHAFGAQADFRKFQIEEALPIVNSRSPQEFREDDSHDVIGTFDAIEESKAHPVVPQTQDGLEERLQA